MVNMPIMPPWDEFVLFMPLFMALFGNMAVHIFFDWFFRDQAADSPARRLDRYMFNYLQRLVESKGTSGAKYAADMEMLDKLLKASRVHEEPETVQGARLDAIQKLGKDLWAAQVREGETAMSLNEWFEDREKGVDAAQDEAVAHYVWVEEN